MDGYYPFEENQIVYEDNHLIIINKKSGQIVQADITKIPCLIDDIKDYIKVKYQKPGMVFLGSPHRIDRPTTGIVIFAKTSKALTRVVDLFKYRKIQKSYWAMVRNPLEPKEARLINYLKKNGKNNKSTAFPRPAPGAKEAILSYQTLETLDNYSLVEVALETGRHHQIRAQMSFHGNPIKGDVKYGDSRPNKDKSIALHARKVAFIHPVKKTKMSIEAPIISTEPIWAASELVKKEDARLANN